MRAVEIAMGVVITALAIGQASPAQAQAPASKPDADDGPVREAASAFMKSYNAGDSKAVAALFTEDAELLSEDGEVVSGRAAIAEHFASVFADAKGAKLALEVELVRSITPDVAIEEGRAVVTPVEGDPEASRYEAIHVRKDGRWHQARVRELPAPDPSPHDRLKPLEWILGDWVDQGPDGLVHSTCKWSEDGNFLVRTFEVTVLGKPEFTVTQRIGWDQSLKQVRAWVFDSRGGHSEQTWSRSGPQRWVIKSSGVLPDGRRVTATNILTKTGKDSATWISTDRTTGGEALEDTEEVHLVRRPPPPK